jgi:muramoyltetrapeptide carboxypeptidase
VADPGRLEKGIAYLKCRGFEVRSGANVLSAEGYFAGADDARADDLNSMFADPEIDAIVCARGGYGSARILERVDYPLVRRSPKIFVGYSDVTALSMAFFEKARLLTFAGPMVAPDLHEQPDALTEASFWNMLMRPLTGRRLNAGDARALREGTAQGRLLGGNLAVLVTLLGTAFEPNWEGSILFLEDVGENVYRIDRMLNHLKLAGVLARIKGVILGRFNAIPEDVPNRDLTDVFRDAFLPLGVPVLNGIPFGHAMPKITLPMGATINLDAGRKRIAVLHPVVS